MSNFYSLMYGGAGANYRVARRCASVDCNSCKTGGCGLPAEAGPRGACAPTYDPYRPGSNPSIGCTPAQRSSVVAGAFDRQFYQRLDQYYGMYNHYMKRLMALAVCRRRMAAAGRALMANKVAAAVAEVEKAANAVNAADADAADTVAEDIDAIGAKVAQVGEQIGAMVNDARNNGRNASVAAQRAADGVQQLADGNVNEAGNKLVEAGEQLLKAAGNDVNKQAAANAVKEFGEAVQQAGADLADEQADAGQERAALAELEKEVAQQVDESVKAQIQAAAQNEVTQASNNGGGVAPPSLAPAPAASANNAAISDQLAAHLNAPGVTAKNAAANFEAQSKNQLPYARRHARAIREIYARYGSSCSRCVPAEFKQHSVAGEISNWLHAGPKAAYAATVAEFGSPDWVVNKPGGEAVWQNRAFYSRITLRDVPHAHFLCFAVQGIDLPLEGIDELARLSELVTYDAATDTLKSRHSFAGGNVAALIVAIDLAHDDTMSLEEAQQALPQLIQDAADPDRYAEMVQALAQDVMEARAVAGQPRAAPPLPTPLAGNNASGTAATNAQQ